MSIVNTIHLTPSQAITAAIPVMESGYSVMLHGSPGIGKSQIIKSAAAEKGWDVRVEMLSQKIAGEVKGLPWINQKTSQTVWALPDFLPRERPSRPLVLFLDELLPATSPEVLIAAYELLNDRKLGNYTLPDNVYLIGAGNRPEDATFSYEMPSALSDRLCHFYIRADWKEWKEWALSNKIHPNVLGFLEVRPKCLDSEFSEDTDDSSENLIKPTPRSWERVSNILYQMSPEQISLPNSMAFAYGWLGLLTARSFEKYLRLAMSSAPIEEYLNNWNKPAVLRKLSPTQMDVLYGLVYNLVYICQKLDDYQVVTFIIHELCSIEDGMYRREIEMAAYSQMITAMEKNMILRDFVHTEACQKFVLPVSDKLFNLSA